MPERPSAYLVTVRLMWTSFLHTLGIYEHQQEAAESALRRSAAENGNRPCDRENPDILLCDEPTGALDYNTEEILKLIETVNQKYGNTIVWSQRCDQGYNRPCCAAADGMITKTTAMNIKIPAAELEW